MTRRVSYADGGAGLEATIIASWDRDAMSPAFGSNGLKDQFKNQVWQVLQDQPEIDRVLMLHGNGPTFCLFRVAGEWYDHDGKHVTIKPGGTT